MSGMTGTTAADELDGIPADEGKAELPGIMFGRFPSSSSSGGLSIGSDAGLSAAPPETSRLSSTLTERLSETRDSFHEHGDPFMEPVLQQPSTTPVAPWAFVDHPGAEEPSARLPLAASVKGFVNSNHEKEPALPSKGLKIGNGSQPRAQGRVSQSAKESSQQAPPSPPQQKPVLAKGSIMAVPGREGSAPTYVVEEVVDFELPDEKIQEILEQEFPFGCDAGGRIAPPFFGTCVPRTCAQDAKGKCA